MAAFCAYRILVDACDGAGMGVVHAGAVCARTIVSPSVVQRAGEAPSGVHVFAGDPLALGAARYEPGYRCGRSGRQPRISAVWPMVARARVDEPADLRFC